MNYHQLLREALGESADEARRWAFLEIFRTHRHQAAHIGIQVADWVSTDARCFLPEQASKSLIERAFPIDNNPLPDEGPVVTWLQIAFISSASRKVEYRRDPPQVLPPDRVMEFARCGLSQENLSVLARFLQSPAAPWLAELASLQPYAKVVQNQSEMEPGCVLRSIASAEELDVYQQFWNRARMCHHESPLEPEVAKTVETWITQGLRESWMSRAKRHLRLTLVSYFSARRWWMSRAKRHLRLTRRHGPPVHPDVAVSTLLENPPACDHHQLTLFVDKLHDLNLDIVRILPWKITRKLASLIDKTDDMPAVRSDLIQVCLEACMSRQSGRDTGISGRLKAILNAARPFNGDFRRAILRAINCLAAG